MKIAFFAYPHFRFPPKSFGPIQTVVSNIVKGLAKRGGYDITVFATGNSDLPAKIIPIKETPDISDKTVPDVKIYEFLALGELIKRRNDFDLISSHVGFHLLPFAKLFSCPIIVNLQGSYDNPNYYKFFEKYKNDAFFVTISDSQREYLPELNFIDTVYHGIEINDFPFNHQPKKDQLAFLGRIDPTKGVAEAVQVALKSGLKLEIRGPQTGQTKEIEKYINEKIQPFVDNRKIVFLGEASNEEKLRLLRGSLALLFPINQKEPFGLVMIEAMACGTPVIAFGLGSVPEVIKDGETGFIVKPDDIDGMVKAVKKIYAMPEKEYQQMRWNCRKHVEENFTVGKMVDGYERVYKRILIKEHQ